jgi:hypothetical protein
MRGILWQVLALRSAQCQVESAEALARLFFRADSSTLVAAAGSVQNGNFLEQILLVIRA